MSIVEGSDAADVADRILQATRTASDATSLKRSTDWGTEIHAHHAETLRIVTAFTRIEDDSVRDMLAQVAEILARARTAGHDA